MSTDLSSLAEPSQAESLSAYIERGSRLLISLKREAHLARLEARVVELEMALAHAQTGQENRLVDFLNRYDADHHPTSIPPHQDFFPAVPEPTSQTFASQKVGSQNVGNQNVGNQNVGNQNVGNQNVDSQSLECIENQANESSATVGWDSYLPYARARLSRPADGDADNETNLGSMAEPQLRLLRAPTFLDPFDECNAFDESNKSDDDDPQSDKPVHFDLGVTIDGTLAASPGRANAAINRPMMSGMSLSLVGHIGLLLSLFWITYKLPQDSAGLGSQIMTVSASNESLDFNQSVSSVEAVNVDLEIADVSPTDAVQANPVSLREIQAPDTAQVSPLNSSSKGGNSAASELMNAAGKLKSGGGGSTSGTSGVPKVGGKFFGVGSGGNFFCYVVDSSGSMRGGAWESAKIELLRSLQSLTEKQRFYIVFFSKDVLAIPEPGEREPAAFGLNATPANIDHARRWIDSVKLDRGGPPNNALAVAIQLDPDAIYLLTDGVTKVDVCAFLRERNRIDDIISGQQIRVPIHAIAYHSLDGQALMRQLAQENKGQFIYVPAK